jgi:hypothetical protein
MKRAEKCPSRRRREETSIPCRAKAQAITRAVVRWMMDALVDAALREKR